jgi:hypothetical protein
MRTSGRGRLAGLLAALATAAWLALSTAATCSAETLTLGKTSVGRSKEVFASDRKRVNSYPLGSSATVTQLSVYLEPTSISGQQTIEGVVYADSKGAPGALVGVSTPITFASTESAGWYALVFPSPRELSPASYWIGVLTGATWGVIGYRYDSVAGSRAVNQNTFTAGPSNPFGAFSSDSQQMSLYAVYTSGSGTTSTPVNSSPPTVSGIAQEGKTLTEAHGSWTNEPTSFAYQWQQCDSSGGSCHALVGATAKTYVPGAADVGHALRVQEIARNAGGSSEPATSAATAPVTAQGATATFGKTSVGTLRDGGMFANYKIVHVATLAAAGAVTKLSLYAVPGIKSPAAQSLKAVIYADSGGSPGALVATGVEVVYQGNVNGSGWFDLPFASPVSLAPDSYWLGFITGGETEGVGYLYDSVSGSRAYNTNAYSSGPSDPFGAATKDSEQASIYATYSPTGGSAPENTAPPSISGIAQQGQVLTASPGTWTNNPTSYAYAWQRCNSSGINCTSISGAIAGTYTPTEADIGSTLRVAVTASNQAGTSKPARSAATEVVTAAGAGGVAHLEYVLQDGSISVYDMDNEFKLLKTTSIAQTAKSEVRGVTVSPSTHEMFIMHGGDGPTNGSGNGSVLAYDMVEERVLWDVALSTGIDSGQVAPDGKTLYIPTGENTSSGIWNVLSAKDGALLGTIQGGSGAHNTVVSSNGRYVYLGGRNYRYLDVYETETGKVKEVGPLIGTVRPFTVNGSNTLAFTTATSYDGFQVSQIQTGKVLFSVSFGEVPGTFPFSAPSHGIALSRDEKTLYVIDAVHKVVQLYDVSKVKEGVAPKPIAVIPVAGLAGSESPCIYDCTRGGWLQLSLDGRYLFVGDSGEVVDTATRKVITTLPTLAQTKKSIEVDWRGGVPIATSGRTGVGYVE